MDKYLYPFSNSPNSRFLYASTWVEIYQFDLMADDIAGSRVLIGEYDGYHNISSTTFNIHALAPDGKVYISVPGSTYYLHVIHKPDCPGLKSELQQHAVELPILNFSAVPHFPHYRNAPINVDCDSIYTTTNTEAVLGNIRIFPNPTSGNITLELDVQKGDYVVELFDLLGRRKLAERIRSQRSVIDIGTFEEGIYLYTISSNIGIIGKGKIVKTE